MRRVKWRSQALADLKRIHAWLSTIEGADPDRAIVRIRKAATTLARLGDIGRPSRIEGAREMSVRNAPYIIAYEAKPGLIDIRAVFHTAQDR